ncbi:hypothetical protein [Luxibacter massiliensis]|uniref:hypothetical protein n=1 Tax=Luxibacter massiliensis TaxID=2219695 RepID=UPI000F04C4E4|nr:hypothetical protein [Luxibacter massiliensis]
MRKYNLIFNLGVPIIVLLLLIATIVGNFGYEYLSDIFLLSALVYLALFFLKMINLKKLSLHILGQLILIFGALFGVTLLLIIFNHDNLKIYTSIPCLVIFEFIFVISLYLFMQKYNVNDFMHKIINLSYLKYYLIGFVFILLTLSQLNSLAKADADYYLKATENAVLWNFSLDSTFSYLRLGNHASYGCSIFMLLGHIIMPSDGIGIRIINILTILITAALLPSIMRYFNSKLKEYELFLLTVLFLFSPLVFGLITEINVDLYAMCFFIWVIHAHIHKHNLLLFVNCILMVFTKETNILILFLYGLAFLVVNIKYDRFSQVKRDKSIIIILTAGIIWLILTVGMGQLWSSVSGTSLQYSENGKQINVFGINFPLILSKLKELFAINYMWIITLVIFLIGTYVVINTVTNKNHRNGQLFQKPIIFAVICSYAGFLFTNLFFITYAYYRYIQLQIFYLVLLLAYLLKYVNKNSIKIPMLIVFIVTTFSANYYTSDFITLKLFKTINVGKGKIITTRTIAPLDNSTISMEQKILENYYFPQSIIYNRQYLYQEQCIEKGMRKINYSKDDLIVISPITTNRTMFEITGQTSSEGTQLFWNENKGFITKKETNIPITWFEYNENTDLDFSNYDSVYLFSFPYGVGGDYINEFSDYEKNTVSSNIWVLDIIKLK